MKLTLGDRLLIALRHRGMTQKELAEKCHFSAFAICSYINDKTVPDWSHIKLLSKALCVDPVWIKFGKDADI